MLTVHGGSNDDTASCMSDGVMPLHASNDDSFLSSYAAAMYEHGTARCPWNISAAPGQKIHLYVLDFSLSARYRALRGNNQHEVVDRLAELNYCHMYATVREPSRAGAGDTPICASDKREALVYKSDTNSIVVQMSSHAVEDPTANFIIKFKGSKSHLESVIIIHDR